MPYIINWDEYPEAKEIIPDYLKRDFEKYFVGEYIRTSNLTDHLTHLNDFLKTLSSQELAIFLSIKGYNGRDYIIGNTFIEILLHCLERTGPTAKRPILFAIYYITSKDEKSRYIISEKFEIIEKIANSDNNNIKGMALSILNELKKEFKIPSKSQFIFEKDKTFDFFNEFKTVISRAKNYVWFWDNYADSEILQYLNAHSDLNNISDIRILCNDNNRTTKFVTDLKLAITKFQTQYPGIKIEARSSKSSHDRFLLFDNERWFLGPSLKDAGKKICSMVQYKDEEAQKLYDIYQTEWLISNVI
ncbi:MAG: hypothetical protein HN704_17760 [Bacteroidetes bacterium]|nr:hypothetical protein [Bacteroidota bacterium]MBT6687253.1 hypothetical protein [Bacteroidota bacterium]MBT7143732.1 hypothetical protein [Bacteroidota bacterium]MBT7493447.1 hypothetical protein [Bacteroidota bacterium]